MIRSRWRGIDRRLAICTCASVRSGRPKRNTARVACISRSSIRGDYSVRPRFEYLSVSAFSDFAQSPSVIRLTGRIPPRAGHVAFRYGLALGTHALNVRIGDGPVETHWIVGGATSEPVSLAAPASALTRDDVARQNLALGLTHILPHGLDHILFVLGIFLLTTRWRSVVAQVSTFTLAHSMTLALTMYGIVSLPAKTIEPMIALSIVYVAIENLIVAESARNPLQRHNRRAVRFCCHACVVSAC
jgi:hypothetical protein